jgi:hypothetical protein
VKIFQARHTGALLALLFALHGCDGGRRYEQALCALIDVSGTYSDQKVEAVRILKREVLPAMEPGDTLLVIRIDDASYEQDNVVALETLDPRPSRANAQKLALARALDAFAASASGSRHTDIAGAMMLGAEYLAELQAGSRIMLVFSDMQEDLPQGAVRRLEEGEFQGIRVMAMNVKRLQGDTTAPHVFRERLAGWEKRVTAASADSWGTLAAR